jgi:methionyl-tRNA formyltransferase
MWIDGGIDTGNLIATEFTDLTPSDNLNMIHLKVMNHAHDLCIRALSAIENNKAPNVKQSDIESGKTYYTRQWNLRAKMNLLKNLNKFRKEINSEKIKLNRKDVVLVHLPQTN